MSTSPRTVSAKQAESFGGGRFALRRRIGEGSMGSVYLVHDRERKIDVALKTLRRADATSIYRFKREFRALTDLVHPNLVAFYDLFHDAGLYYFTMEYVEGRDFLTHVLGASRHAYVDTPRSTPELLEYVKGQSDVRGLQTRGLEMLFPTPLGDEDRLRDALTQIAHGLSAIHAAGKLHRDLKSDNVLVTSDGRAKVLDFGISIERPTGIHGTFEAGVMGTPAYMSPEQAGGRVVDEATDWYALGVMLYEALTGTVPFDGDYLEIMHQKQHADPLPPSQLVSGVPHDLDELCRRLLERDPGARPDGGAVLRALEYRRAPSMRPPKLAGSSIPLEADAPFVGRTEELAALRRYLAQTDRGKPVVSLVSGPSGIGKTMLVERFIAEVRDAEGSVVLRGRCYERESVPFKAFDSLIDALSRHLRRLQPADAAEVLPRDILALAQVFPVLKRVDVVALVKRRTPLPVDRQELRARAFTALRELLRRLADRRPLLLFIDDLQWGDVDSAQLLSELLRMPDAPALLLLVSYRSGEAGNRPCLSALSAVARENDDFEMHELALQPLSSSESVELARRLLGDVPGAAVSGLGVESQGNPHMLTELVRHVARGKRSGTASPDTLRGVVSFERALSQRLAELSVDSRTLLELLSVAGRPVPEENLAFVSSFDIDLQHALTELRGAKLVRGVGIHARRAIETYHDRIREAVVAALPPDRLELWHKRLASTFEATGEGDLEAIVEHLIGAGDAKRAQIYAIRAATQAADALAFEKAARLFAIAVENQDDQVWGHELLVRWADALVNAGHGRQAASVYLEASRSAPAPEATVFREKAGLYLLASGHHDEALELLGGTLGQLGVEISASAEQSARELQRLRERIARRGLAFAARDSAPPPAALDRHDMSWTLALYLLQVEPERALPLIARCLLDAFELGDAMRVVRALCLCHVAIELRHAPLPGAQAGAALAAAEALERTIADPEASARVEFVHGLLALGHAQLKPALSALSRAEELLRSNCRGAAPEMRLCRVALAYMRVSYLQIERLAGIEPWSDDAEEHEDLLSGTRLRLLTTLGALAANAPERAERMLARAVARFGAERVGPLSLMHAQARAMLALYRGDAANAATVAPDFDAFFASDLAAVPLLRGDALLWRARVGLAAVRGRGGDDPLYDAIERDARAMAELRLECFEPRVRLLRAGLAARRGERDLSLTLLEAVLADDAEQPDMPLLRAAAERSKGGLLGASDRPALIARADAALSAQGVADPAAFARLLAPGFETD